MSESTSERSAMKPIRTFWKVGSCSEAIMNVLDHAYGHPLAAEEHAAMPLAGGVARQGYQCGMLWGASLAAGAEAFRRVGPGPKAEAAAIAASKKALDAFEKRYKSINCLEITDTDWKKTTAMLKNFLKGGPITCFRMAGTYAPMALDAIDAALSTDEALAAMDAEIPVGCAAMIAKKMGATPMQITMAAGFAGGIGLSGGGCGALGAAIWLTEMREGKSGENFKLVMTRSETLVERFLRFSDYTFECEEITGRRFESIDDHCAYLKEGGCARLIDALAESCSTA